MYNYSMKQLLTNMIATMTQDELLEAMYTDTLTSIWNRRAFELSPTSPVLAIIDLDSLKWVNDNAGHRHGDILLVHVARTLEKLFGDNAFRLSGDEFVVRGETVKDLFSKLDTNDRIFSFGVGSTLDTADARLRKDKSSREAAGTRASRGEAPTFFKLDELTLGSKEG
jgi:GGDEF domain-containing protein